MGVASRYVRSLLTLAVERNALEEVHNDMRLFSAVVEENRNLELMLKNPVIKHHMKRAVLEKLFKARVHPLTSAIFDIITKKNREPLLPLIAKEFHNAYNAHKGIGKATVTTAVPLDEKTRAELLKIVKAVNQQDTSELKEQVDEELIGGFILDIGDRQIDASISSRLKSLRSEFSQNPYIKEF